MLFRFGEVNSESGRNQVRRELAAGDRRHFDNVLLARTQAGKLSLDEMAEAWGFPAADLFGLPDEFPVPVPLLDRFVAREFFDDRAHEQRISASVAMNQLLQSGGKMIVGESAGEVLLHSVFGQIAGPQLRA
ncbi:MAG TPA: hypothetical protein VLL57_07260 [Candidatus Binataceae bacterium]|nr:hypothetical protein [Candidatus Binataceae bacterium]